MHEIDDAVVRDGKITLAGLPFADGQHVRIIVAELHGPPQPKRPIAEVRRVLQGGVERFDEPLEPLIPGDSWEMLK